MIERGEFALQDMKTKRQLSLNDQWATLFYPGMRVAMDIIYTLGITFEASRIKCPNCGHLSLSSKNPTSW